MKIIKRVIALILFAALAVSMTSCLALDEAKEHQMFYNNESRTEILYKDKVYKEFLAEGKYTDYNRYLRLKYTTKWMLLNNGYGYTVNEKDVPVLLSGWEGSSAEYDPENDIIWNYDDMYFPADKYDEYAAMFTDPQLDGLAYEKYTMPAEKDRRKYGERTATLEELSPDLEKAVFDAMSTEKIDEDMLEMVNVGGYSVFELYLISKDGPVVSSDPVRIYKYKNYYYVITYYEYEGYKLDTLIGSNLEDIGESQYYAYYDGDFDNYIDGIYYD